MSKHLQPEDRMASLQLLGSDILNTLMKISPEAMPLIPALTMTETHTGGITIGLVLRGREAVFSTQIANPRTLDTPAGRKQVVQSMRSALTFLALTWAWGYKDGQGTLASRFDEWLETEEKKPTGAGNLDAQFQAGRKQVLDEIKKMVGKPVTEGEVARQAKKNAEAMG